MKKIGRSNVSARLESKLDWLSRRLSISVYKIVQRRTGVDFVGLMGLPEPQFKRLQAKLLQDAETGVAATIQRFKGEGHLQVV